MNKKAVITGLFFSMMLISAYAHGTQYELSFTGHITTVDDGILFSPPIPLWSQYASVGDQFTGNLLFSDVQVLAPWAAAHGVADYVYPWVYTIDVNGVIIYGYNNNPSDPPGPVSSLEFYDDGSMRSLVDEIPFVSVPVPTDILAMYIDPDGSGGFSIEFPYDGGRLAGSFDQVNTRQVPEPSTILLIGAGLVGLGFVRKRFKG